MRNFFIVGAQRCSTTWLYEMLNAHPEIQMNPQVRPEPKYFLNQDSVDCASSYFESVFPFQILSRSMIYGEKSTSYIESYDAAVRIKKTFPTAKIVVLLRDPVKRALSNFKFSIDNGLETRSCLDAILERKDKPTLEHTFSTDPFNYLQRGKYEKYLEMYFSLFSKENIGIFCQESITKNIDDLQSVYRYLSVDSHFEPERYETIHNKAESPSDSIIISSLYSELKGYYEPTYEYVSKFIDISSWMR
ncbi:sulfotransferase family protein [Vibrio sp. MA40-2]|uniref:sulfotransferase family protein n=1 Tax=Vibrio sp. MA40-2 TaxID=3391828 RepID=UPI0039A6A4CC